MAGAVDRRALGEALLELLEEDREFRHAVMGLLGYREVLERITRLEERFARLEERFAKLEEEFLELRRAQQRLEERQQRLEERFQKLEERFAELEEHFARLEERFAKLEEEFQKLEERQQRLEERMARLEEEMRETRRVLNTIAHRFGLLTETGFREAMRYVVEEALGAARVERLSLRDEEGLVYGYPATVDIDLVVRDGEHIIVEVKSRVDPGDVAVLARKARLYERETGTRPRAVILGGYVAPSAYEAAARLGVTVRPYLRED
ncbi:PD-(D/E)XK nuclease family protein [Pyrodictium abyssi]|uniref:DUF3782 domain-containing protein n=1 Tax=Pyrodictium abyssi TaxID=54256 RepID=A0ABM8IUC0_9CREN|nr:DUF3782 domain-containing protein [Pyrodictium abyssi]